MDRAALIDRLADHIAGGRQHPLGVAGLMIEDEIRVGRKPIQPGAESPFVFPAADWVFPAVVSLDGREVRLVAILAQEPGSGAFRRLVDSIIAADLTPVVVCPVGLVMPAILKRWKWKRRIVGARWDRVDEWRPPTAPIPPTPTVSVSSTREGSAIASRSLPAVGLETPSHSGKEGS